MFKSIYSSKDINSYSYLSKVKKTDNIIELYEDDENKNDNDNFKKMKEDLNKINNNFVKKIKNL